MDIYYYKSKFVLGIGIAYLIFSAQEENDFYAAEGFTIFAPIRWVTARLGKKFLVRLHMIRYPKVEDISYKDFLEIEIDYCNKDLDTNIIEKLYTTRTDIRGVEIEFKFQLKGPNLLREIATKHPEALQQIRDQTKNEKLQKLLAQAAGNGSSFLTE